MIIGIDFDGTIADTNAAKSAWIQRELKIKVDPYCCDRTSCVPIIGELAYNRMSKEVYNRDTTYGLKPVTGVLQAISELRKNHELLVVTARYGEMLESAETWLSRYPETRDVKLVGRPNETVPKSTICRNENVQILVDDDERHLYPILEIGINGLLFKNGAPEELTSNKLLVCRSWEEIVSFVNEKRD